MLIRELRCNRDTKSHNKKSCIYCPLVTCKLMLSTKNYHKSKRIILNLRHVKSEQINKI